MVILHAVQWTLDCALPGLIQWPGTELKNDCACVTGNPVGEAVGAKIST